MTGNDTDAHGCKASAGYLWNEELASCVRPWISSAVTIELAPQRRDCANGDASSCWKIRERTPGKKPSAWTRLEQSIQGFEAQPGHRYQLRVRKDLPETPEAAASHVRYTLLKILP